MPAHDSHEHDNHDHDNTGGHDRPARDDREADRRWWLWDELGRAPVPGLRCTPSCDLRDNTAQHDPGTAYTHAHHATTGYADDGHDDGDEDVR